MTDNQKRKEQGSRLKLARQTAGFRSAREAAHFCGWPESTYRAHENGTRTIGFDDAERYARRFRRSGAMLSGQDIIFGPTSRSSAVAPVSARSVAVMGLVGAGATIEPESEQVSPDGLYTVDLPFYVPHGLIALEVNGPAMLPRYDDKDVILVWAEQRYATENYVGEEVAIRTSDGRRFLKRLLRGPTRRQYTLESGPGFPAIEGVGVEWVGEVYLTMKLGQMHRVRARAEAILHRQLSDSDDA